MDSVREFPNRPVDDLWEAKRWVIRSRKLLQGGADGRVIEDTRKGLEIIERYISKAIGKLEQMDVDSDSETEEMTKSHKEFKNRHGVDPNPFNR